MHKVNKKDTFFERVIADWVQIREVIADFFVSENGSVSWQWDYIRRTGN